MNTEPVAIARAWVEAANRQDNRRIAELSSVDIEIVGPRGSVRGIDVLREWLVRAGLTLESKRIFARGNAVVMEQHGRWRSIETGEVIGETEVASRFEVHEGRVALLLGIVSVIAFALLCTLLPFLPGRYDGLAVPLSSMAQTAGIAGLALVPVGILWFVVNRSSRLTAMRSGVAFAALVMASLVWALASLIAFVQSGFVLGLVSLAIGIYAVRRIWPELKRIGGVIQAVLPLCLVIVPGTIAVLQLALREPAVEFSRNRAIQNSVPLITAIEQYHATHDRYPVSLLAVWPDYSPGVIGIKEYRYEPYGDAYNLLFEQFTYRVGTREIVMYNPLDEHVMTSHAIDLLRLTPEQLTLERARGHYARNDAPHPHWKYFWFD